MAGNWTQVSQMTIKEMADFSRNLAQTVSRQPEPDRLRAAIDQALGAECVQCGIKLSGSELLKFADETSDDERVERLRMGYCARNGCESLFYRVTCAPHPEVNWPGLLNPTYELSAEEKAAAELAKKRYSLARIRNKTLVRVGIAFALLLIVFIARQIYLGGSIPFVREPEDFRVDREVAQP
jgi:hypothetical protein